MVPNTILNKFSINRILPKGGYINFKAPNLSIVKSIFTTTDYCGYPFSLDQLFKVLGSKLLDMDSFSKRVFKKTPQTYFKFVGAQSNCDATVSCMRWLYIRASALSRVVPLYKRYAYIQLRQFKHPQKKHATIILVLASQVVVAERWNSVKAHNSKAKNGTHLLSTNFLMLQGGWPY
jgi:hypothetical protein